ncbi:MAG TPA: sigma-70 family RNA polymerase sigma factor [Myxococcales bacterium]|nr:sigma-70 family RNA polymerase sigma factor [Myxococcales bacterium]
MKTTAAALPVAQDEATLVAALRAGDEKVFVALVRELHPSMLRVASLFVSSRALAEEVVQETWLGVLKGLAAFEGRSSLRRWIFGILTNCAKARGTREARSVPFSSVGTQENEDEPVVDPSRFLPADHPRWPGHWSAPPVAWADEKLIQQESLQAAQRAIDQLPRSQREVIVLRDVEGWESDEVCELLGLTEVNQRVLLHRARSRVRAALELHFQAGGRQ